MSKNAEDNQIVLRSRVEVKSHYSDYREILRFDFWYFCAYCSMTKIEATGIGFQIDHYYPRKHKPELTHEYSNLMWSCARCNSVCHAPQIALTALVDYGNAEHQRTKEDK